jgi:uncharacterized membrane protein
LKNLAAATPTIAPIAEPIAETAAAPTQADTAEPRVTIEPVSAPIIAASGSEPTPEPVPRRSFEERLAGSWAIWIGAATIGLAAIFLVRYSIEQGWFEPVARVVAGIGLGVILLLAAEWLRRRVIDGPAQGFLGKLGTPPPMIPPAVTSGGVVALFAAVYAAFALYQLIGPIAAFIALAAVAALAMALSLLHGPFVALLGQVAAFAVPALASTGRGAALPLFIYVAAVAASCLALARYRFARWMAWPALAGAVFWVLLWFLVGWRVGDAPVLAVFLVALAALHNHLGPAPLEEDELPFVPGLSRDAIPDIALLVIAALAFILLRVAHYDSAALIGMLVLFALIAFDARRRQRLDRLPALVALIAIAALVLWHEPFLVEPPAIAAPLDPSLVLAPQAWRFITWCAVFGAAFFVAGAVTTSGATRPGIWALLAAIGPAATFAVAYARIEDFAIAPFWAFAALGIAGAQLFMAQFCLKHRDASGMNVALGLYAFGVVLALGLASAMILRLGWLTVGLAVQLPLLAWIERKLDVRELRLCAAVVALLVLARLVLNPEIVDYPIGTMPIFNGLLYICGLPMLAFAFAARIFFATRGRDRVVELHELGALISLVLMLTLLIDHATNDGKLGVVAFGLRETALQSLAWLGVAFVLFLRAPLLDLRIADWGWQIIGVIGVTIAIIGSLITNLPFDSREGVGSWPIANWLTLAYLVPAMIGVGFAWVAAQRGMTVLAGCAGTLALVLAFVDVTLETMRAFRGSHLPLDDRAGGAEVELYTISLVWLAFGIAVFVFGLRLGLARLRQAALLVFALTTLKVFLLDMSTLTGVLRALSFLGLGVALLGLGWLYQRVVMQRSADARTG